MNELSPYQIKLVQEFFIEQRIRKILTRLSLLFSLGAGFGFLILLFNGGYLADPTLAILMYWGLFTNISSTLLIPYYAIPNLILGLQSEQNEELRTLKLQLLRLDPERFLYPSLREKGYRDQLDISEITVSFLEEKFQLQDRFNWKSLGKFYFCIYCFISIVCFYFFIQADF